MTTLFPDGIKIIPNEEKKPKTNFDVLDKQKEGYVLPQKFKDYFSLIEGDNPRMGFLALFLSGAGEMSKKEIVEGLQLFYKGETINLEQYNRMLELLGEETTTETEHTPEQSDVSDIKDEKKEEVVTGNVEKYRSQLILEIDKLINEGRPLKWMRHFVKTATSDEEIRSLMEADFAEGILPKDEYEKMLMLINGYDVPSEGVHQDVTEEDIGSQPPEESQQEEVIKEGIDLARDKYAQAKAEYSRANSKYLKIKQILSTLTSNGATTLNSNVSPIELVLKEAKENLDVALTEYINEKKLKIEKILQEPTTVEEEMEIDPESQMSDEDFKIAITKTRRAKWAEEEWSELEKTINGLTPKNEKTEKIKEILFKASGVWGKVPMKVRLTAVPLLLGTGAGFVGGLAVGATYTGARILRAGAGAFSSKYVGEKYGGKIERENAETKKQYEEEYVTDDPEKTFEEKERRYMTAREVEAKRKKAQQIKKALLQVGAGAGAGILTGLAESALNSIPSISSGEASVFARVKGIVPPESPKATAIIPETPIKPAQAINEIPIKTQSLEALSTKVELSPKGFLQDIHNLKAEILKQYGQDVPPELKTNILNRPTVEIAKEYGLYEPNNPVSESAMGHAGEKLGIDNTGHLVIENTNGTKKFFFDNETGSVRKFAELEEEKVLSPKSVEETPVAKVAVQPETLDSPKSQNIVETTKEPEIVKTVIPPEPEIKISNEEFLQTKAPELKEVLSQPIEKIDVNHLEPSPNHIPFRGAFVDIFDKAGIKTVEIDGLQIAEERPYSFGKIMTLADKFQEGQQYTELREAFTKAFDNSNPFTGTSRYTSIPFEGGKISLVQDPNNTGGISVLLNGKEIAKGIVENENIKVQYSEGLPKSGWLFSDNAYERAFSQVKKFIKTIKVVK